MHVDWNWIQQRPHFLARELAKYFDIRVGYCRFYTASRLVTNERDGRIAYASLMRIPALLTERSVFARLNDLVLSHQVGRLLRKADVDYVWLGAPSLYPAIRGTVGRRQVIYDCMDDCGGFGSESARARAVAEERSLLQRADLVVVSSERLGEVVRHRGYRGRPLLVNNALADRLLSVRAPGRERCTSDPYVLLYWGTIGYWFDFASVLQVLERFPNVHVRLAGPAEVTLPEHDRLEHIGPVRHEELPALAASADVLIMPFVVNDLIRGVDPVKIYEYIAFGRPIVVPDYPEMRRFDAFVHRYGPAEGLTSVLASLLRDRTRKYSDEQAAAFLSQNTWSSRAHQVALAIQDL